MKHRSERLVAVVSPAYSRRTWPVLSLIVVLVLTACGGGGQATPTLAPPSVTPSATPTVAVVPPAIGQVTWTTAIDPATDAPATPAASFPTTAKTIYAVVEAPDLPRGTTLSASWSFNGAPVQIPSQTVTIIHEERRSWVEFHLSWIGGGDWPDGTLKVTIAVDGTPARTAEVTIKRPSGPLRDDLS